MTVSRPLDESQRDVNSCLGMCQWVTSGAEQEIPTESSFDLFFPDDIVHERAQMHTEK